jgi:hypothetical protein
MKKILGVLALLLAALMLGGVGYGLLVAKTGFQKGMIIAIGAGVTVGAVGLKWLKE